MPVLNGFEFLGFFNSMNFPSNEKIKIVILSSSVRWDDIENTRILKAVDSIVKPLSELKLRQVIDKHFYPPLNLSL